MQNRFIENQILNDYPQLSAFSSPKRSVNPDPHLSPDSDEVAISSLVVTHLITEFPESYTYYFG